MLTLYLNETARLNPDKTDCDAAQHNFHYMVWKENLGWAPISRLLISLQLKQLHVYHNQA